MSQGLSVVIGVTVNPQTFSELSSIPNNPKWQSNKMELYKILLVLVLLFATILIPPTHGDDDVGEDGDPAPANDDSEVQLDLTKKFLFSAPVYCPSNYLMDSRGRCRRIEY